MQFFSPVAEKALIGHVFKTVQVETGDQCEIRCYGDHQCLSVNLGPYQDYGHACELSKSDHVRHPDDLVPRPGYLYKGTKVMRHTGHNQLLCYFSRRTFFVSKTYSKTTSSPRGGGIVKTYGRTQDQR